MTTTAKSNQFLSMQVFRDETDEEFNIDFSSDEGQSNKKKSKVQKRNIINQSFDYGAKSFSKEETKRSVIRKKGVS